MHALHDVALPDDVEPFVPAVIEIPRGSRLKYEIDKPTGLLRLDRVLYSAVHYPANYGFIPRTHADDGDPLDILVLGNEPVVPLALMRARPIGVMHMRDEGQHDDKIIAVHVHDPAFADITDLEGVPQHTFLEIRRFFADYKTLENKEVLVDSPEGARSAVEVIRQAMFLYRREENRLRGWG